MYVYFVLIKEKFGKRGLKESSRLVSKLGRRDSLRDTWTKITNFMYKRSNVLNTLCPWFPNKLSFSWKLNYKNFTLCMIEYTRQKGVKLHIDFYNSPRFGLFIISKNLFFPFFQGRSFFCSNFNASFLFILSFILCKIMYIGSLFYCMEPPHPIDTKNSLFYLQVF